MCQGGGADAYMIKIAQYFWYTNFMCLCFTSVTDEVCIFTFSQTAVPCLCQESLGNHIINISVSNDAVGYKF